MGERAGVCAGLEVVLANAVVGEDATMPDTAIGDDLDRICAIYGLTVAPAQALRATSPSPAPGGVLRRRAGMHQQQDRLSLPRGRCVERDQRGPLSVVGIDVGDATDLDAGEVLTWTSPPFGLRCHLHRGLWRAHQRRRSGHR